MRHVLSLLAFTAVGMVAHPAMAQTIGQVDGATAGLGLAVVRTTDAPPPLRFYAHPDFDEVPDEIAVAAAQVVDSLTFRPGRGRAAVRTVPAGFAPELLEPDAGHVAMRVLTLSRTWAEVMLDGSGRTAWVPLDRVDVQAWGEVLPNVFGVTAPDPEANPIRTGPSEDAPILATTDAGWRLPPLAVRGDWLLVSTLGLADRIPPSGWVRWRRDGRLVVTIAYDDCRPGRPGAQSRIL
jgi:hypothetical protein